MQKKEPIFKSVFNEQWDNLPPIMLKHYANRPYSNDSYIATGKMDIEFSWLMQIAAPLLTLFGTLVPIKGRDIKTTVTFNSEIDSPAFRLDRIFNFDDKKPFVFESKLIQVEKNIMLEIMKSGICWKHQFSFEDNKVVLKHIGYYVLIFEKLIPLPISWLFGKGYAEEWAISDNEFKMKMMIEHPIFGTIYTYSGQFKIEDKANE
ncbi:MAG: DUF4166 domain-containing protein [Rhizobiales bacterium]|nr:DUF4166 domain-containing protein [Hyphomicrobiales bacterium]